MTGVQPVYTESIYNLPTDNQIIGWGFNPLTEKQNVWIRFRLLDINDGNTADGWYIDDVRIYSRMWGRLSTEMGVASGGVQDENYILSGGTSMATPLTAGAAALVRQYYTDLHGINPSAALLKATLINGATDMPGQYGPGNGAGEPIPNFHEGWGRVDLSNSILPNSPRIMRFWDEDPTNRVFNSAMNPSQTFTITNCVPSEVLRITLVWTDAPSSPAGPALQNNLDLRVTYQTPGTSFSYGNDFNGGSAIQYYPPPSNPNWDTQNNVECVYIPNPGPNKYTIEVIPTSINTAGQTYALVISYGQAYETIRLWQGWNLISLPLQPDRPYITEVLRDIDGSWDCVQYWDASDQVDHWKQYLVGKPFGNDLFYLYQHMGFYIHILPSGPLDMKVYGAHFSENQEVELFMSTGGGPSGSGSGWNLVGYPSGANNQRDYVLNNLRFDEHIDAIWWFDAATQTWHNMPYADDLFVLGRGYWFHMILLPTPPIWEVPVG